MDAEGSEQQELGAAREKEVEEHVGVAEAVLVEPVVVESAAVVDSTAADQLDATGQFIPHVAYDAVLVEPVGVGPIVRGGTVEVQLDAP